MTDWKLPWQAQCLCGQVQITISEPPVASFACHCRDCQKLTGSAYSLTLMLPAHGFKAKGETEIGGLHRDSLRHHFCTYCKNWLYTDGFAEGLVNFRPTLLDDANWIVPFAETVICEKLPAAHTGATMSFDRFPDESDFPAILEGFTNSGIHPN